MCHNNYYYIHYLYCEIPPFLVFLVSSLSSIKGEDVAPLCLVEEVDTKSAGLSHRLPVDAAVFGKVSV